MIINDNDNEVHLRKSSKQVFSKQLIQVSPWLFAPGNPWALN